MLEKDKLYTEALYEAVREARRLNVTICQFLRDLEAAWADVRNQERDCDNSEWRRLVKF